MSARLLKPVEVAERLGVSRARAYELMHQMFHVRMGKSIRVSERALGNFIARQTLEPQCHAPTKIGSIASRATRLGMAGTTTGRAPAAGSASKPVTVLSPANDSEPSSETPRLRAVQPRTNRRT